MKIKFKLSVIVIAIMVIAVVGLSFILLRQASDISMDLSLKSMTYLNEKQVEYWKSWEDGYIRMLRTMANTMSGYEDMTPELRRYNYNRMLESALNSDPYMFTIYTIWKPNTIDGMDAQFIGQVGAGPVGQFASVWTRETGQVEHRSAGSDIGPTMAYLTGPNAQRDRVEDPELRSILGKDIFLVRLMVPIINPRTGEIVGGVACLLNNAPKQFVLEEVIENYDGISAMALYTNTGFILASYRPERVGKNLLDVDNLYGDQMQTVFQAVKNGEHIMLASYSPSLRTNLEISLISFNIGNSNTTWTVMIAQEDAYIMTGVRLMTTYTIIVAAIAILVMAVIIFLVLHFMTKPIVLVADTLKDIAQGEGDLTRVIVEKGNDEISLMSRYFNQTIGKIKTMVISIRNEASNLSQIGSDLANNMTETAAAINEITTNIQSIKQRMINQSASVTETNATMEQITVNINKLNGHVEKQTDSVSRSSSAIEEMLANIQSVTQTLVRNSQNVNELTGASEIGRSGLHEVALDIKEITQESEGLLEINAVMKNIASQTNLLSMNAAIEAAHAGEAGKGFAVVADEIRKLAESSSEQSKTISMILIKMKNSIDKITHSTENVLTKFEAIDTSVRVVAEQEENIRNAMEEQGQGSKQILDAISLVNETTLMVKSGSEEMLDGAKEVMHEADNLEKATQEISGGMNEMAIGANEINSAVHHISELSTNNRESINRLMQEVSRFKIE
ncbi:MAG: methyl-accepting chemotaxis protein [Treponema sp.]|jgi:methyl-accepting chemotaxis protein|nr:methyl-accepting chemotaxis protein [Treponema sp.]